MYSRKGSRLSYFSCSVLVQDPSPIISAAMLDNLVWLLAQSVHS